MAPPAQGPTLAWSSPTQHYAATMAGGAVVFMLGLLVVGAGPGILTFWFTWVITGLAAAGVYHSGRVDSLAAGANWLARGERWVEIYSLASITCSADASRPVLVLLDTAGRRMSLTVVSLRYDRQVLDLVYNGILHSVVAGRARTNLQVHPTLGLPSPHPDEPAGQVESD